MKILVACKIDKNDRQITTEQGEKKGNFYQNYLLK